MKKSILLSLFILTNAFGYSQNAIADSLKILLSTALNDSLKINLNNEIAFQLYEMSPDSARLYAGEALRLSKELGSQAQLADSYVRLGLITSNQSDYPGALAFYQQAQTIRTNLRDTIGIVNVYSNLGNLYESWEKYDEAVIEFEKGLVFTNHSKFGELRAKLLSNLGGTLKYKGEYEKAIQAFLNAIEIREGLQDSRGLAYSYAGLGSLYEQIDDHSKALDAYKKSLDLFTITNPSIIPAIYFNIGNVYFAQGDYDGAWDSYDKFQQSSSAPALNKSKLYNSLGAVLQEKMLYAEARKYYARSLALIDTLDEQREQAVIKNNLGKLFYLERDYQSALPLFDEALSLLDSIEDNLIRLQIIDNIAGVYTQLEDFEKALLYSSQGSTIEKTLNKEEKEVLRYEREIAELSEESAKQKTKHQRQIFIIIGLGLLVLVLVALFSAERQRRKKQVAESQVQDKQKRIYDLMQEIELKSTYAKLEGQDLERKRIAQDLHDRLGSMLSTVKLYFNAVDAKLSELKVENRNQYDKANNLLEEACEEVRIIAHNMQSGVLAKFGLDSALKDIADTLEESKEIKVTVSTIGLGNRLEQSVETNIYRIIQELVSNVLKHAQANELTIRVNRYNGSLNILVEDDGVGFDPDVALTKGGMGLKSIESRVNNLGGILNIDSGKGAGTTVSIDLEI